jgi:hypothetical protein
MANLTQSSNVRLTVDDVVVGAATPLPVTVTAGGGSGGVVNHATTGLGHGTTPNLAANGVAQLTGVSTPAKWVTVQARTQNTLPVAVGAAGVAATVAGAGILLGPGESITLPCDNLQDVYYAIGAVANEGVRYVYGTGV